MATTLLMCIPGPGNMVCPSPPDLETPPGAELQRPNRDPNIGFTEERTPKLLRPSTPWDATEQPQRVSSPAPTRAIAPTKLGHTAYCLDPAVHLRVTGIPARRGALTSERLGGLRHNFPSRGQRAAAPPRLGSAPGTAGRPSRVPKAPCSLRSSGSLATLTYPSQYRRGLNRQPAPRPRQPMTGSSGSGSAVSGEPKAQAPRGLKGTGPPLLNNGSSSLPEHINLLAERAYTLTSHRNSSF
ncbi:PREDICTED: translation initiation factor IF-2-like [Rhinopithecus bieti]|uniref:translation initiation factor IF-2-like n=1 Tax=Rhinopithecus bieti TaxID=61621 RepID=UPI00083C4B01|nr:PREDICTED: translation initiation factor IF-2-like [Rhinopithecus bieti]